MATVSPTGAESAHRTLTSMVRAMFPHARFPEGPYQRTAASILDAAEQDVRLRAQLEQGLRHLDSAAGRPFTELDEAAALEILRRMTTSDFFKLVQSKTVTTLYDDHEVWTLLGYEGPSYEQGGYVDRGFADLDWLPEPRIEEPAS
jgi:hypothetical protein